MKNMHFFRKLSAIALAMASLGMLQPAVANVCFKGRDIKAEKLNYTPIKRWSVEVGGVNYSVNLPNYRLPVTFGDWDPANPSPPPPSGPDEGFNAADTAIGNKAILANLNISYQLENNPLLPRYFTNEAIAFDFNFFNRANTSHKLYSGATGEDAGAAHGVIWLINDSEIPMYGGGALRIVDSTIHATVHYHNAGLYLKGDMIKFLDNVKSKSRFGFVGTSFDQRYTYIVNATTQGIAHLPIQSRGDDSLVANYLGFDLGDRFDYNFAPAFSLFVDGDVQALYAATKLIERQTPDDLAETMGVYSDYRHVIRVHDDDHRFTYRAQVQTGISFYPGLYNNPNSARLSVFVGLDQWGYVPQAVTIAGLNSRMPHIEAHSMRNFFAGVNVTLPIV